MTNHPNQIPEAGLPFNLARIIIACCWIIGMYLAITV